MICVPITARSFDEAVLDLVAAKNRGADMVELRIDLLEDLNFENFEELVRSAGLPVIVTTRIQAEGGEWRYGEEMRLKYFEKAVEIGVDYVDIEFFSGLRVPDLGKTKLIFSYHNFEKTPSLDELWEIYQKMIAKGADIGKIVTMARDKADNEVIYELIIRADRGRIIALAMGESGRESRIKAQNNGSFLTFAALSPDKISAPGQITIDDLKNIALIGGRGSGKSFYAKKLSKELGMPVFSTDERIKEKMGKSVKEIIDEHGWSYFRDLEYQVLKELAEKRGIIIDCGGGIVCEQGENGAQSFSERKSALLKSMAKVIWVKAPLEVQVERIQNSNDRPSLTGDDFIKEMVNVMKIRQPWYEKVADEVVEN